MRLHPIVSALRRNKVGALVIAIQMGITLAILANALFVIQQRLERSLQPTGTDESRLFAIGNQWVGAPAELSGLTETDLSALRAIPGVDDAYATNAYPLGTSGWVDSIYLHSDQVEPASVGELYFADEHTISTLGLKLVAGRNFHPTEVTPRGAFDTVSPQVIIVTRALAQALFPGGNAIGRSVYVESRARPATIIGVVETLQMPHLAMTGAMRQYIENSILEPFRFVNQNSTYIVRTAPERLDSVMQQARQRLIGVNRARVLNSVQSLTSWRAVAYRDDRGLAISLCVVCVALVAVTTFGIVGLTAYWVTQRRRQIGIRRALGASRMAIVRYFQMENLLIAILGAFIGVVLSLTLNVWMVNAFEMTRLHLSYILVGVVLILMLGQIAALWPALRAASTPPGLAARST